MGEGAFRFAKPQKKQNGVTVGSNLLLNMVLSFMFYYYVFDNPDEGTKCWASKGSNEPSPTAGDVNVARTFGVWLKAGFFIHSMGVIQGLLFCCCFVSTEILRFGTFFLTLLLAIFGIVLRYSHGG